MVERKDLILQSEVPARVELQKTEPMLAIQAEEAAVLLMMTETRGWQLLLEKFIQPRMSLSRLLATQGGRARDEALGAVSELTELMHFVEGRIKEGRSATTQLETLKKQRRSTDAEQT